MFSDCVWGCRKCFIRNNMEVLKVMDRMVELGVGIGNGGVS